MGDTGGMAEQDIRTSGALVGILQAETRHAERRAEHMKATGTDLGTNNAVSWVTFSDGTEQTISTNDVLGYMRANRGNILGDDVLESTYLGGTLERLDVRLEAIGDDFTFGPNGGIPILASGMMGGEFVDGMRADIPYFAMFDDDKDTMGARIMACDASALFSLAENRADAWEVFEIRLTDETGEPATKDSVYLTEQDGTQHTLGEAGLDPEHLYAYQSKETGHWLTYYDLLAGLAIQRASMGVAEQMWEAKRIKELPRQDTAKPHRQYDPDTKVANLMASPEFFGDAGALLNVAGASERRRNKSVEVAVSFSVDDGVQLSRPISAYDRDVHRAISSRWVAGGRNITVSQIANDMGIRKPTKNQIRKVEESIELQRRVFGHIDFSEEARNKQLRFPDGTPVTEFVVDGHLIEAQRVTMRSANGHEVKGYHLVSAPLLYQHAAAVEQVVSYPQRWLEFGTGSDTDKHILLRSQLLRQVSRIKNPKWKKSMNIRFTTDPKHPERPCLFSRAVINQSDRHARKDATEYVISVLDDLKADGAIKGYKLNQQTTRGGKKSTYGVTIKP